MDRANKLKCAIMQIQLGQTPASFKIPFHGLVPSETRVAVEQSLLRALQKVLDDAIAEYEAKRCTLEWFSTVLNEIERDF